MNSSSTVANGIGQPVRRKEDLRLLTGRGSFADDVSLPELAHAVIVRSPMPMGILHPSTKEQRLGRLVCSRCSPAATMWRMGSGRSPTAVGSWAYPMWRFGFEASSRSQPAITRCRPIGPALSASPSLWSWLRPSIRPRMRQSCSRSPMSHCRRWLGLPTR